MDTALARIEAALRRIEAAAPRGDAGSADLRQRHDRLKASVGEALSELDALIEDAGK